MGAGFDSVVIYCSDGANGVAGGGGQVLILC
jgi:hypothetical protein